MSQFYTKEQTDQLATIIGQRIKASVSTNSVTAALLESDKYVLLTKAEKASLATGNISPAANNDSFLDALEKGFNPISDTGLAKDYSGTGWYKATDTGTVFNKDVPEGETHVFSDSPTEYVSVYTIDDAKLYGKRAATSNFTNMSEMFVGSASFNQDISSWDVGSVTNMSGMFYDETTFNSDISSWNTSNVTDMSSMFRNATTFNQNLSNWCVTLLPTKPVNFETGSALLPEQLPVWGTCPRGENTLT